mmetsp:Transcript_30299/g.96864  ORF Transcript_30299/g.96864 Transcript_30299/m.96864 type:complete len:315 (+) Transcript_30299:703-1647(+)
MSTTRETNRTVRCKSLELMTSAWQSRVPPLLLRYRNHCLPQPSLWAPGQRILQWSRISRLRTSRSLTKPEGPRKKVELQPKGWQSTRENRCSLLGCTTGKEGKPEPRRFVHLQRTVTTLLPCSASVPLATWSQGARPTAPSASPFPSAFLSLSAPSFCSLCLIKVAAFWVYLWSSNVLRRALCSSSVMPLLRWARPQREEASANEIQPSFANSAAFTRSSWSSPARLAPLPGFRCGVCHSPSSMGLRKAAAFSVYLKVASVWSNVLLSTAARALPSWASSQSCRASANEICPSRAKASALSRSARSYTTPSICL